MTPTATDTATLIREGLDQMAQGMSIFDADLKLVTWNRRFLDLLKFPAELAFVGADFDSFIRYNALNGEYGPGDVEDQVAQRVAQARTFVPHEFERLAADGTVIRVTGSPLPAGGFVTVYTDVTEERSREQELESRVARRTEQLQFSEARLKLIADEVPAGIAHVDRDMKILFVNRRFARAYGDEPANLIGKMCDEVLLPETLRKSHRYFEQARRGALVDFEIPITLPSGQRRDVRTYLRPEQPSDGEVIGFYLLSVDVTHRKAATQALLQSQKMDALGRLSSGISHDFNNLLAVVLGNLVPLSEQIEDPVLKEEFLDPALAAARRGSALTRRLLTLARSAPIDPCSVQLEDRLVDLVKLLRASIPESVSITYSCQANLPYVWIDPAQLEMALLNLAVNARDAMDGQGELAIQVDTYQLEAKEAELRKLPAGHYVRLSVSDDGCGITPSLRENIFEPFFTSKSETGGNGLGLAMVFGFVRQSNGAIWVDSEPGHGSDFTILLPMSERSVETQPPKPATETMIAERSKASLVLLVEDNEDIRKVVRRQLNDLGYPLIEAENASVARDLMASVEGIDIVLSDVSMPGEMDGMELANLLRKNDPDIGIVLMSGQHQRWADCHSKACPYTFLGKPFEIRDLANALTVEARRSRVASEPVK